MDLYSKMSDLKSAILWNIRTEFRPFRVECSNHEVMNKYHYVFTIPRCVMKNRATNFMQFRSEYGQLKNAFHFFLDFMQAMVVSKEKKSTLQDGQNTLCFVEWCRGSTAMDELNTAGWRVHVFVDRATNEMAVLRTFLQQRAAEVVKLKKQNKYVPQHYALNSLVQYNAKVYGPYTGKQGNLTHLYSVDTGLENSPSACFEMKEMEGSIYPLESYVDLTGSFTFPSFDFIQVDPKQISYEHFAQRRLPDHLMFDDAKPEVRIWRDQGLHVEFQPHRYYRDFEVEWDETTLTQFISENKDKYVIYEEGRTDAFFDLGEMTLSKKLHDGEDLVGRLDLHDMHNIEACTEYSKMLQHQASISMVDHIKLDAHGREDKDKFIEEEFLAHVYEDYEDALISKPMKHVMGWLQKEYDFEFLQKHIHHMGGYKLRYEDMSVFGHRVLFGMQVFDELYQICSAHHPLHFLLLARCDAGRHVHGLHLNAIFTGDAATSKSYLLNNVLAANSIGGTVSERTYDTAKADAVDTDKDHGVHVFDEAPATYFPDTKDKGGANTAQKRKLTECSTSHRRLHTDEETGVRKQVDSISSSIGCSFVATNESRTSFDKAFQTRFHFFESEKLLKVAPGKGMQDRIQALETMSEARIVQKRATEMWFKFEQAYVFTAWQFIHMGRIRKPDTTAFNMVSSRFQQAMLGYGINTESITRTMKRVKLLCQICAIIRAKQILYCTETGKYVNTPFHPSQLPDAEQYMIVTEEIAIHCIGMCFEAIVSRSRNKVLAAIWKIHTDNPVYKASVMGEPDLNYIEIMATKSILQTKIQTALESMQENVGLCNIATVLTELKRNVMTKGYGSKKVGVPGVFNDGFPEYDGNPRSFQMCEQHPTKFLFHLELFADIRKQEETNIYKSIMKDLGHEFTADKLIVLGTKDYTLPTRPDVFDTIRLGPRNGRRIKQQQGIGPVRNTFGITGNEAARSDVVLNRDVDVYAAKQRSDNVGYEIEPYEPNDDDWNEDLETSYPPPEIQRNSIEPARKKQRTN